MSVSIEVAAQTDVGCVRENNEDSFGYDPARQVYAVCDGMGGMAAGEVASGTAVHALLQYFQQMAPAGAAGNGPVESVLLGAVLAANDAVRRVVAEHPECSGMGTTLVAACCSAPSHLFVANVGDSRAYLVRGGDCVQVTADHSLVAEQLRKGALTPEMAAASPLQSIITRAVGVADEVEPDIFRVDLTSGDVIVMATDGLTRYVEADEIRSLIGAAPTLQDACLALVETAKQRGGADNITCLLLRADLLDDANPS